MSNKDTSGQKNDPAIKKLMEPKVHTIKQELIDISKARIDYPYLDALLKTPKTSPNAKNN